MISVDREFCFHNLLFVCTEPALGCICHRWPLLCLLWRMRHCSVCFSFSVCKTLFSWFSIPGRKKKIKEQGSLNITAVTTYPYTQPRYYRWQTLRRMCKNFPAASLGWQLDLNWENYLLFSCQSFGVPGCIAPQCVCVFQKVIHLSQGSKGLFCSL